MVRKLVSLAFGRVAFVLLVTSFASGQTCNSDACNYCGAIAAAGTLGCALSGQGGACEDEVLAEYQQCLAAATALPRTHRAPISYLRRDRRDSLVRVRSVPHLVRRASSSRP